MSEVKKAWKKWSDGQRAIAILSVAILIISMAFVIREAGWFGVNGPGEPGYDITEEEQIPIGKLMNPIDNQIVENSFSVRVIFTDPNSDMVWSKVSYRTGDGTYRTFMDKKTYAGVKTDSRTKTLNFSPRKESYVLTFKMEGGDARGLDSIIEKSVTLYFSSQKATTTPGVTPGAPASVIPGFTLVFALISIVVVIFVRKHKGRYK